MTPTAPKPGPHHGPTCHHCGHANPRQPVKHCRKSLTCNWWECGHCHAINDPNGHAMPGDNTPRRPAA